jgi:hypothetical protein
MIRPSDPEIENPYEAPRPATGRGAMARDRPPWVYVAFSIYCMVIALVYGSLGLFVAADWQLGLLGDPADRPDRHVLPAVVVICLAVAALFAAGPFLPRRPWAWTYGLILILVGNLFALPLTLFWIGRGARGYYARIPDCVKVISEFPHASRSPTRLRRLRRG